MRRLCALAALVASSCASTPESREPTPVVVVPSAEERLATCRDAMQNDDVRLTVMACRALWTDATCQAGWEAALAVPRGDRPKVVLDACLPAYCADGMPADICGWPRETVDVSADAPDWFAGWDALNARVLPVELNGKVEGPEAGAFARHLLMRVALQR